MKIEPNYNAKSSHKFPAVNAFFAFLIPVVRFATNLIIVVLIVALLIFMTTEVYDVLQTSFLDPKGRNFLHDVAFFLVFVKALKILTSYLASYRVSLNYIIEISIIAPAIEIIFAPDKHSLPLVIVLAIFSITNLVFYIFWSDRIIQLDDKFDARNIKHRV
ncbi:hypothetical protein COU78_05040 [Candidatus Peregrinibacteria bacterium CG10_big_fil_rev_8_21_14_0_10_49_24]|nr:MAG: hypothetical protein COV83_01410 [Candidatus Peregrinibacteria bacterium CG11_big_fil_rev_8_21_14_0_20_49_14]PIR50713.1 MAG: hypothetical protein COU78_05040 [Candidatus Peregrinibacteria bacterium CG10_big_fil_rev_8_21_14_0_10_49_24]PJA68243.1 MAG: hypothetical protein CO157_00770 [Candidatus Peregrinibacteria bacterium CG_4_9_14_3_um_filter_49_12]